MGNYTAQEYIDLFGGLPEGECKPDLDAIRERDEELHGSEATRGTPAGGLGREGLLKGPPAGTSSDHRCDVCEAPPGYHHLSYCDLRGEV